MNERKKTVWIIERDSESVSYYREVLSQRYSLRYLKSSAELKKVSEIDDLKQPDLVISDLKHLGSAALKSTLSVPVLLIAFCNEEETVRRALEAGVVDFLSKPVNSFELLIKIERFFKRSSSEEGRITLSSEEFCVKKSGYLRAELTAKEFQVFSILKNSNGNCVSREAIQKIIWKDVNITSKAFDVHLFNLRKKLFKLGAEIRYIDPSGYILVTPE
jgi:DNA-binding response OmpR family regulator